MGNDKQVVPGIWCPWAQVLCLACHGPVIKRGGPMGDVVISDWDRREIPVEPSEGEGIGSCDKCHRPCLVRDDVALLCQVRDALAQIGDAPAMHLEQTGGMCAALVGGNSTRTVVVSAMDGPFVGVYNVGVEGDWGECDDLIEDVGGEFPEDDVHAGVMLVIGALACASPEIR